MIKRKPPEFPLAVAKAFIRAMEDYFTEQDPTRRDAIAVHQLDVLKQYQGPREKPLRKRRETDVPADEEPIKLNIGPPMPSLQLLTGASPIELGTISAEKDWR